MSSSPPFPTRSSNAAAAAQAERSVPGTHLDSILKIPVVVQVFVGSTSMPIADLMALERGAVIALNHDISDPVDIVVNGRTIARGELVALDDDPSKIGVKLVEIVGQPDPAA